MLFAADAARRGKVCAPSRLLGRCHRHHSSAGFSSAGLFLAILLIVSLTSSANERSQGGGGVVVVASAAAAAAAEEPASPSLSRSGVAPSPPTAATAPTPPPPISSPSSSSVRSLVLSALSLVFPGFGAGDDTYSHEDGEVASWPPPPPPPSPSPAGLLSRVLARGQWAQRLETDDYDLYFGDEAAVCPEVGPAPLLEAAMGEPTRLATSLVCLPAPTSAPHASSSSASSAAETAGDAVIGDFAEGLSALLRADRRRRRGRHPRRPRMLEWSEYPRLARALPLLARSTAELLRLREEMRAWHAGARALGDDPDRHRHLRRLLYLLTNGTVVPGWRPPADPSEEAEAAEAAAVGGGSVESVKAALLAACVNASELHGCRRRALQRHYVARAAAALRARPALLPSAAALRAAQELEERRRVGVVRAYTVDGRRVRDPEAAATAFLRHVRLLWDDAAREAAAAAAARHNTSPPLLPRARLEDLLGFDADTGSSNSSNNNAGGGRHNNTRRARAMLHPADLSVRVPGVPRSLRYRFPPARPPSLAALLLHTRGGDTDDGDDNDGGEAAGADLLTAPHAAAFEALPAVYAALCRAPATVRCGPLLVAIHVRHSETWERVPRWELRVPDVPVRLGAWRALLDLVGSGAADADGDDDDSIREEEEEEEEEEEGAPAAPGANTSTYAAADADGDDSEDSARAAELRRRRRRQDVRRHYPLHSVRAVAPFIVPAVNHDSQALRVYDVLARTRGDTSAARVVLDVVAELFERGVLQLHTLSPEEVAEADARRREQAEERQRKRREKDKKAQNERQQREREGNTTAAAGAADGDSASTSPTPPSSSSNHTDNRTADDGEEDEEDLVPFTSAILFNLTLAHVLAGDMANNSNKGDGDSGGSGRPRPLRGPPSALLQWFYTRDYYEKASAAARAARQQRSWERASAAGLRRWLLGVAAGAAPSVNNNNNNSNNATATSSVPPSPVLFSSFCSTALFVAREVALCLCENAFALATGGMLVAQLLWNRRRPRNSAVW